VTAAGLAARLTGLPPADVPAVSLYLEVKRTDTLDIYLARLEEIDQAVAQLNRQLDTIKRISAQCQQMPSRPSRIPPPGL